jgi:hypothetical protein
MTNKANHTTPLPPNLARSSGVTLLPKIFFLFFNLLSTTINFPLWNLDLRKKLTAINR